jgi:aquaporin Z
MVHYLKIFMSEVIGTFILVVFATGSIVFDAKYDQEFGIAFISFAHFIGLAIAVYAFGKISMAHFNPAVTVGFLITKHMPKRQLVTYFLAEITGAVLGSLVVKHGLGNYGNLGANSPNYSFPLPIIYGIEIIATILLMGVILFVVHKKGLRGFGGVAIAGIVALDVLFFANISGASMNPARSLAPVLFTNTLGDLWLYWSAPFIGAGITAYAYKLIDERRQAIRYSG